MTTEKRILLLGIGNDILMDDGIGPLIVRMLEKEISNPEIHFDTLCLGGLEILEYIRSYTHVYIIDAIKTENGQVGDLFFLTPSDFRETLHLSSLHDVGFLTALELAARLDMEIPSEIRIAAVEIREDTVFGSSLSPELQEMLETIFKEIKSEIVSWIDSLYKD